jgi:Anti-sigma-K factor rskA
VVVTTSGTSYFVNRGLPKLPAGRTYQLWGFVGDTPISLGLLGRDPRSVAFALGRDAPVHAVAVTPERDGGSVHPSVAPVASGPT